MFWHSYDRDTILMTAPEAPGVYTISSMIEFVDREVFIMLYVGESGDIRRRLLQHWSGSEKTKCLRKYHASHFRFEIITDQWGRENMQARLDRQNLLVELFIPICQG